MSLFRRTTPVALMVGATIGVIIAAFQSVDAIFANPGIVVSFDNLIELLLRAFFLYVLWSLAALFIINLFLCLLFKRKMAEADYPRLIEYYVGVALFIFLLVFYSWKDKATISDILHSRRGAFPRIFFFLEVLVITGGVSFVIAGAVHQLARKLKPGRLAIFISSFIWFLLLYPLIGEGVIWGFLINASHIVQIIVLLILVIPVSILIRYMNRLTHALIALNKKAWIGFGGTIAMILIIGGIISLLQPKPTYAPRSGSEINVILVSIDALRADHLGCYGYNPLNPMIEEGQFTPNIDKLASEGLLFENAISTSTWTLASISSWMTGAWPVESGGTHLNRRVFDALPTLPEKLRQNGYNCAGFVTNPFLGPQTNIGRGFGEYWEFFDAVHMTSGLFVDELNTWVRSKMDLSGMKAVNRMIVDDQLGEAYDWLDKNHKDKFFMWIHLYDPHHPYSPPPPYDEDIPDIGGEKRIPAYGGLPQQREGSAHHRQGLKRHIINLYDGELRYSDEVVGDILAKLDELGLSDNTLVIFTSDHGEEFFDHNNLEHGHASYNETVQVPLIFKLPGKIPAGQRITERISMIDLFPTILDFTDSSLDESRLHRGESLMAAILTGDMSNAGSGQMNFVPWAVDGQVPMPSGEIDEDLEKRFFPKSDYLPSGRLAGIWLDELPGDNDPPSTPEDAISDAADEFHDSAISRITGSKPEMPTGRVIFTEDLIYDDYEEKSITIGDWKLIHSRNRFHDYYLKFGPDFPRPADSPLPDFIEGDELYDLKDDPYEIKNVIYDRPDIARYLYERLMEIDYLDRREAVQRKMVEGENPGFGAGLRNALKGLGYITQ